MKQVSTSKRSLIMSLSLNHSIFQQKALFKYRLLLLLAGIALLIGGCTKESPFCKKTVPFKAEFIVTVTVVKEGSPGVPEQDHVTGVGEGAPIGKATFDARTESDIFAPEPQLVTGKQTITAQNGDKIFTTVEGYAIGPDANGDIKIILNNKITGGTGKYADATGSFSSLATANIENPIGHASSDGSITY